ncbi:nucleotidyltransferase [Sulfolobales archaeon HS-7]|nr:nucleotidyltransferase [Sulfolobales archaeon HS-7]
MGEDSFLDRDALMDKRGNYYIVIGNAHPRGYVIAYLKYVKGNGLWRGYQRVLPQYGIKNVLQLSQEFSFEPCMDVSVPIIRTSEIWLHLRPQDALTRIIRHPSDNLEFVAVEMISRLGTNSAGIAGSLMLGIHHEDSDIDVIYYGCKRSLDVMHSFEGFETDKDWIVEVSQNYGLKPIKDLYSIKRRGIFKGKKYSINFVNDKPEKFCKESCNKVGRQKLVAYVEPESCEALFYPISMNLFDTNVISGPSVKPDKVMSYEGVISNLLFVGGRFKMEGMLMKCDTGFKLILGDRDVGLKIDKL